MQPERGYRLVAGKPVADRSARDHRVRALRARGWSLRAIAGQVALSETGVRKSLLRTGEDISDEAHEAALAAEIGALIVRIRPLQMRILELGAELHSLVMARETAELDRLLGLNS